MTVLSLRVNGFVENCGRTLAAVPTSPMPKRMWRAMGMAPPIKQSGVHRSVNQPDRSNFSLRIFADLVAGVLNEARVESISTSSGATALQG
jgi:hypothetical protein